MRYPNALLLCDAPPTLAKGPCGRGAMQAIGDDTANTLSDGSV